MARVRSAVKRERAFKNTFAPSCEEQELTVGDIVTGMRFGLFKYRHLPPEVRGAVDEEIERMRKEAQREDETGDWKLMMLDLGMGAAGHEGVPGHGANHNTEFARLPRTATDPFAACFQRQAAPQIAPRSPARGQAGVDTVGFGAFCARRNAHGQARN